MTDRFGISKMIMGILETRKGYKLVPKKLSEHIVSTIEHPKKSGGNYRTCTLIDYLHERKMLFVVTNNVFGERVVVDGPEKVHYAIQRGMDFFKLSDGDLINEGIDYHTAKDKSVSIGIERFCLLMARLEFEIMVIDNQK